MLKSKRKKYCIICYWLEYAPHETDFFFRRKDGRPKSSIKRFKTFEACKKYIRANNKHDYVLTRYKYTAKGRYILRIWDVTP